MCIENTLYISLGFGVYGGGGRGDRNTEETYRSATDQHVPGNYPLLEKFHIWSGISPYGKSIFLPEWGGDEGGVDLPVSFVVHEFEPNELRMYISKHRYPLSGSRPIETQDPIYLFCGLAITKPCQYKNVLPLDKDPALWKAPSITGHIPTQAPITGERKKQKTK